MNKPLLLSVLSVLAFQPALANVIIDKSGVDEKDYIYDLHQCEEMSNQVQKEQASGGAVSGAVKGAAIGSAGVAIAGGSGTEGAKKGAAVGLAAGVLNRNRSRQNNENQYQEDRSAVVKNCMTHRGYVVLN
ncbi:glycine zipper family protein [Vibrio sp. ZSDZ34]|uniref:Glycine zipper family protein n=1 Tax=Vibrio gelatinilyticus TaxID=2893468 RepID=A0A9X1WA97_9VIBR|nr:glycine zipper family protein [Vibrio gelatinilyticus]MCJ2376371.1 glycine zipper family protein [Vibrio gelatinilyticus]